MYGVRYCVVTCVVRWSLSRDECCAGYLLQHEGDEDVGAGAQDCEDGDEPENQQYDDADGVYYRESISNICISCCESGYHQRLVLLCFYSGRVASCPPRFQNSAFGKKKRFATTIYL